MRHHRFLVLRSDEPWPECVSVTHGGVPDVWREYRPERPCRIVHDPVHRDCCCSAFGERFDTGAYGARDADDVFHHRGFRFCPNCGARAEAHDER